MIKHLNLSNDTNDIDLKFEKAICSGVVVAFIKGTPNAPSDEDSEKLVKILADSGVKYNAFDANSVDAEFSEKIKEKLDKNAAVPFLVVNKVLLGNLS